MTETDIRDDGGRMSRDEFAALIETALRGTAQEREKAGMKILDSLSDMVRAIARSRFGSFLKEHSEDLETEGYIAILESLDKYDPAMSDPVTFFFHRIEHRMKCYVASFMNQTVYNALETSRFLRARANLAKELGYDPDLLQIAEYMDLKVPTVMNLFQTAENGTPESLDVEDAPDSIRDPQPTPEEAAVRNELHDALMSAISALTPPERAVVVMSSALEGPPRTDREISALTGIPPESVRAVRFRAYSKLRESEELSLYAVRFSDRRLPLPFADTEQWKDGGGFFDADA